LRLSLPSLSSSAVYTLSLHDALPICHFVGTCLCGLKSERVILARPNGFSPRLHNLGLKYAFQRFYKALFHSTQVVQAGRKTIWADRKSTRLNSSNVKTSYAALGAEKQ